jgi:hypothetical protein
LVFLLPKICQLFGFPMFWPWAYLVKVNSETSRSN